MNHLIRRNARSGDSRVIVLLILMVILVMGIVLAVSMGFVSNVTKDLGQTKTELQVTRERATEAEDDAAKTGANLRQVGAELVKLRNECSPGGQAEQPVPEPAVTVEPTAEETAKVPAAQPALAAGMKAEEVKRVFGEPDKVLRGGGGDRQFEVWTYKSGEMRFVNGALDKWKTAPAQGAAPSGAVLAARYAAFMRRYVVPATGQIVVHTFRDSAYAHVPMEVTWPVAEEVCEALGGHLATAASADENAFIHKTVEGGGGGVWIGFADLERAGDWQWATGEAKVYTNWLAAQPNDRSSGLHGVEMIANGGQWDDTACSARKPFVCEWSPAQPSQKAPAQQQGSLSLYSEICVRTTTMTEVQRAAYADFLRGQTVQTWGWVVDVKKKDKSSAVQLSPFGPYREVHVELICPADYGVKLQRGQRVGFRAKVDKVDKGGAQPPMLYLTVVRFTN